HLRLGRGLGPLRAVDQRQRAVLPVVLLGTHRRGAVRADVDRHEARPPPVLVDPLKVGLVLEVGEVAGAEPCLPVPVDPQVAGLRLAVSRDDAGDGHVRGVVHHAAAERGATRRGVGELQLVAILEPVVAHFLDTRPDGDVDDLAVAVLAVHAVTCPYSAASASLCRTSISRSASRAASSTRGSYGSNRASSTAWTGATRCRSATRAATRADLR